MGWGRSVTAPRRYGSRASSCSRCPSSAGSSGRRAAPTTGKASAPEPEAISSAASQPEPDCSSESGKASPSSWYVFILKHQSRHKHRFPFTARVPRPRAQPRALALTEQGWPGAAGSCWPLRRAAGTTAPSPPRSWGSRRRAGTAPACTAPSARGHLVGAARVSPQRPAARSPAKLPEPPASARSRQTSLQRYPKDRSNDPSFRSHLINLFSTPPARCPPFGPLSNCSRFLGNICL